METKSYEDAPRIRRVFVPRPLSQIMKEEAVSQIRLSPAPEVAANGTEALDRYIAHVKCLPPAPVVATQLLSLFAETDRDVDRIVELIGVDPSLTAEVLKRCNSASVGLARPVRDMFEAVFQLGFYEVYCIVIASVGSRSMLMLQAESGFKTEDLWRHSVATAAAAATLAKRVQVPEAMSFTAGLLHDIGKLVLSSVERLVYANLMQGASPSGPVLVAAEEANLGFNHAELGARLLERWNLPADVCAAVRYHHSCAMAEAPSQPLPAIVHLANDLAHQFLDKCPDAADISLSSAAALGILKLGADDLPRLSDETREAFQEVEALLQMQPKVACKA